MPEPVVETTGAAPGGRLADRLKAETAEQHRVAETRPLQRALAAATIGPEAYAGWAGRMLAAHRAVAEALRAATERAPDDASRERLEAVAGEQRAHADRLATDLAAMDAADAIVPSPAVDGLAVHLVDVARSEPLAVLGAAYVLEGSMNGNRFLARALAERSPHELPVRYLESYGEAQRVSWLAWREGLDALPWTDPARDAAVRTARRTFEAVGALSDEAMDAAAAPAG